MSTGPQRRWGALLAVALVLFVAPVIVLANSDRGLGLHSAGADLAALLSVAVAFHLPILGSLSLGGRRLDA